MERTAQKLLRSMLQTTWEVGKGPQYAAVLTTSMGEEHKEQLT